MITKDNWRKYIEKLSAIDDRAADLMRAYINENGLEDEAALINYAYALTSKYGDASATLSCEMYDYMAEMMDAGVPEAIPAATATYKEVASGTMWAKYHSPSQIPTIVGRQVRQAGADTMMQNAKRDNAEWAWVPQGDNCVFCITLASRGWQEASKTVLRGSHAEHIHPNCDCTFAIAFKEKDKQQYDYIYDRDKYLNMYNESNGDINALRRKIYDENKDEINAQKRDAYQAKQFEIERIKHIPQEVAIEEREKIRKAKDFDYEKNNNKVGDEYHPSQTNTGELIGNNANDIIQEKIHNVFNIKELSNGLPINGIPNSISDKIDDDGNVLQRRIYGPDGRAEKDIDTTDHGRPDIHPTGAHKHVFDYSKKKPRGGGDKFTDQELEENSDIIQRGVNYYDDE